MNTLSQTTYSFPGQTKYYKGKVRDVYTIDDKLMVMIVSDRISAFDVVLPRPIPYKGQVLNQLAAYFMQATADVVPNWIIDVPDPGVLRRVDRPDRLPPPRAALHVGRIGALREVPDRRSARRRTGAAR